MDGLGHTDSDPHEEDVTNGHMTPWAQEVWSSVNADRRGIEALAGNTGNTAAFPPDSFYNPSSEDPYADELAQRSADVARHAASAAYNDDFDFDAPTPPQGLPQIGTPPPVTWSPPLPPLVDPGPLPPLPEPLIDNGPMPARYEPPVLKDPPLPPPPLSADPSTEEDPPLAAMTLGQRWMFTTEPDDETGPEDEHPLDAFIRRNEPMQWEEPEPETELPQRVPAEPDVPRNELPAESAPDLSQDDVQLIRDVLKRDDVPSLDRPQGFDVDAILKAVREVAGVREATMRTTPAGAHHLRLELAEGADPATISRMVARMLQEQMGLDAALTGDAPRIPGQAEPPPADPPPVVPGPRTGLGAVPPAPGPELRAVRDESRREPRRRHPVTVPRRQPSELRPSERAAATWRTSADPEPPIGTQPPSLPTDREQGPRAIIEHVQTSTFGLDATVEVRLNTGNKQAAGVASGPAVDAYVLRLCAAATAAAIDELLLEGTTTGEPGRCFVEHAAIVPMGSCDVAVVVVLLVCGGWVEQLAGSALVSGDPRRAVVRATLSAVNRRLAALIP